MKKNFKRKSFEPPVQEAAEGTVVDLINKIKDIAEDQMHHPDLHLTGYKNLKVVLYTHALGGVTENDLIVAAKINELG